MNGDEIYIHDDDVNVDGKTEGEDLPRTRSSCGSRF